MKKRWQIMILHQEASRIRRGARITIPGIASEEAGITSNTIIITNMYLN
jgi:predicted ribosome-associated RNA-binding protein Tma20